MIARSSLTQTVLRESEGNSRNRDARRADSRLTGTRSAIDVCSSSLIFYLQLMISFPAPMLAQVEPTDDEDGVSRSALKHRPTALLAQSNIWKSSTRERLSTPRYKKSDLDYRRQKVSGSRNLLTQLIISSVYLDPSFAQWHKMTGSPYSSYNAPSPPLRHPTNLPMASLFSYREAGQCTSSLPSSLPGA